MHRSHTPAPCPPDAREEGIAINNTKHTMPALSGSSSRGRDSHQNQSATTPSPLPSHTHQIMDAFLWNNKSSNRYEQRKHEEVQSLILSRLKRGSAAPAHQHQHPPNEEVQPLVPPRQQPQPRQPQLRQPQLSPMSSLSRLQRSATPAHQHSQAEEVQPLVHPRQQPQLRQPQMSPMNIESTNSISSYEHQGIANAQTTINHRTHNRQRETTQQQPSSSPQQPTNNVRIDDEDEDIVCCDGGVPLNEGAKNLCTIALWALIVFAIVNRFFVHMAMHLHKSPSTVGIAGSDAGQQLEMQPIRMVDGGYQGQLRLDSQSVENDAVSKIMEENENVR